MKWKRLCTVILIAICLLLVWGCGTLPSTPPTDPLPANLLQPCPPIQQLPTDKPVTLGDLYQADHELIQLYGECALRHWQLIEAVSTKEPKK